MASAGRCSSSSRAATRRMLVGTWAAADWAIRFYRRHGFEQVSPERKAELLEDLLDDPGPPGRDLGGAGQPAARRSLTRFTPTSPRRRAAAGVPARLRRHLAHLGARAARPGTPPRRPSSTLAGHAGGPPLGERSATTCWPTRSSVPWTAGFKTAHLAATRSGAMSPFSSRRAAARDGRGVRPAGGWAQKTTRTRHARVQRQMQSWSRSPPRMHALVASLEGRRRATAYSSRTSSTSPWSCSPTRSAGRRLHCGTHPDRPRPPRGWSLDAGQITCPVRVVWGTEDKLLPWPSSAVRYRDEWLPNADWVELKDMGHCPQLDIPLEAAELVLGFTQPRRPGS